MRRWLIMVILTVPCLGLAQPRWVKLHKPTNYTLNRVSFIDSVRGWVAGDSGGIFKTTDGGESWMAQETGVTNNIIDLFVLDRSYGWAVALQFLVDTSWYGTVLFRTTNGGDTWITSHVEGEYYYTIAFHDSVNGWMGGHNGKLMRTTDGGLTWTRALVDSSIVMGFPVLHLDFYSRNYMYAVGGRIEAAGVVWRTTNGGDRWTAMNPDTTGEPLHAVHFIDSLNVFGVWGDFDFGSGMVRSTDGGVSWLWSFLGIWGEARAIAFRTPGHGFVPLGFPGTYMVTKDTGKTWQDFPTPDTSAVFDVKFPDSLHGYMVGVFGSIFKYDPTEVSVGPTARQISETPVLFQNFPNPFNPTTRISYRLPAPGSVSVKVFDMLGRVVATLFRGTQVEGEHEVVFNGDNFSSGVYYYQLTATSVQGRTTQVRKMLLVK